MNISVRTLRLETSKRRRPNSPHHPVQLEVAREISKNWASHLLRGECSVGRTGERSPKWRWPQTRKGKAHENETKEGPRTGVRTSGKTNTTPGWPSLHRTGPGREKHINRGARASSLARSPTRWGALLVSLDQRALTPRRWIFPLSSK